MESYKHQFAKQTLAGWLADPRQALFDFNNASGGGPHGGGVFIEYPFCLDSNGYLRGTTPWHEFESFENDVPTYQQCLDAKLLPICIFDVAFHHEGQITHAFEIVHKHDLTEEKRAYIHRVADDGALECVHGLSADWVLSQVQLPRRLKTLWQITF